MKLQTQRLQIITCTVESLSTFSTDDYEIGPHINMYIKELKKDSTLLGWGVWLVIDKENNKIIGDIGFKGKPNSESTVEVGYGISPLARGKGYATEAVEELIDWAFTFNSVNRVVAECLIDNIPSIRVLEKLNMNKIETKNDMFIWELKK